ncbi:MAG: sporulation inhibitor of replication protein SirA [Firmicutes bacterium]|nr:sporulation inhibitor of replication protein SirA [Bacillota bacterium]
MRTFYIFKIKRELTILTKETPYNLYRTIENLYYLDNDSLGVSFKIYNDLFDLFDKEYINKRIYNLFKNHRYYNKDGDIHTICNKYKPETSTLRVYRSHIILKSDVINPTLLVNYLMTDNLFVCDFKNKDYFWLNEFVR